MKAYNKKRKPKHHIKPRWVEDPLMRGVYYQIGLNVNNSKEKYYGTIWDEKRIWQIRLHNRIYGYLIVWNWVNQKF